MLTARLIRSWYPLTSVSRDNIQPVAISEWLISHHAYKLRPRRTAIVVQVYYPSGKLVRHCAVVETRPSFGRQRPARTRNSRSAGG